MLEEVLTPADCAKCKFCCSFRRESLKFTPHIAGENIEEIRQLFPEALFKTLPDGTITIYLDDNFLTQDSEEEVLCYFNRDGCRLPTRLKPFECKLWPFRLMRKDDSLFLALATSCQRIERKDTARFGKAALEAAKEAVEYAKTHPEIIIEYSEDYQVLVSVSEPGTDEVRFTVNN